MTNKDTQENAVKGLNKLFELADALENSSNNEGCDVDLTVVGSAQLWNLLQHVLALRFLMGLSKLFELADALRNSSSKEGYDADLTVVGSAQLWDLLQHVRQLKAVAQAQDTQAQEMAENVVEQSRAFVKRIASLKKWGEPDENGKPFEPSDGLDDSHSCLMDLIDEARVISTHASKDVPDPMVKVHPVGKPYEWEEWHISQNLTDRWGDLNYHNAGNKPLRPLEEDSTLLERLRTQMWDEMTFIVRKDGKFGILFEAEFCSLESEEHAKDHDPNWYATLNPHAEVVKALLEKMSRLAERFPAVQFAVPDKAQVVNDRPAAWAFVPDGLLTEDQREELGKALLDL